MFWKVRKVKEIALEAIIWLLAGVVMAAAYLLYPLAVIMARVWGKDANELSDELLGKAFPCLKVDFDGIGLAVPLA